MSATSSPPLVAAPPPASELRRFQSSPPDFLSPHRRYPDDEIAQNLVYDAWEAKNTDDKFRLCHRALKQFPFSIDAYNCVASLYQLEYNDPVKAHAAYGHALTCASILMPGIEESEQIPWGVVENRPLLRAYHGLATTHRDKGETKEAVKHLRFLLRVNPSDNQGARMLLFQALIELGEYAEAEAVAELHSNGRKSNECYFRYGFVLIDFMKHKLGVCTKEKLEDTLVEALCVNNFVPYLMLQPETVFELADYMSSGSMDEAISYYNKAVGSWRRVPGLIDWFAELQFREGPKPADNGAILFDLLTKGKLLVGIQRRGESNEISEVTTKVRDIPGTGLESFSLPLGMKDHDPLKIVCYNTGKQAPCPSDGKFVSFSYGAVKEVYFWSLLQNSETFGDLLRGDYCRKCYEPAKLRCSRCLVVWYCSKECQRKDWKKSHKNMCEKLIKK